MEQFLVINRQHLAGRALEVAVSSGGSKSFPHSEDLGIEQASPWMERKRLFFRQAEQIEAISGPAIPRHCPGTVGPIDVIVKLWLLVEHLEAWSGALVAHGFVHRLST